MTKLSVNINKVATLRNARGGNLPDVERFAVDCELFGAQGITGILALIAFILEVCYLFTWAKRE